MAETEYAHFRVSLANGDEPADVAVEIPTDDKFPRTKMLRRHIETARELPDGRKRLEYPVVEAPHDMTPALEEELLAGAIRAYNGIAGKSLAAKQLRIERFTPPDRPATGSVEPKPLQPPRRRGQPEPLDA